jgi:CheY-like chemotaxis protein
VTAANSADILDSLSHLIGALIWPALVLFLVLRFRTQVGGVVDDLRATIQSREFTVKAGPGGVELTAGARAAAVLLEEAEASKGEGAPEPTDVKAAVSSALEVIAAESTAPSRRTDRRILWVDDLPENNRLERRALEELGIEVVLATSTDQALEILGHESFDVVISDMGRPPDARAGYSLLDELRRRGDTTPFVIYAGSRAPEHVEEAQRHGAIGTTNRSSELIQLVAEALNMRQLGNR